MKKILIYLAVFILPLLPVVALAQGIVPCNPKVVNGVMVNNCGFCEVGQLIKNGAGWLAAVMGVVVVLIIIYAGLKMVLAVGNISAKSEARKLIATALIGYALLLGAWMLVDVFLKFLIPGSSYGVANPLICS